jgi:hypothetical protein
MKSFLKIPDVLIIFLAAGLTFFSIFSVYMKPQSSSQVLIQAQDMEWTFPLSAEETVSVSGPLGNTIIRLHNNQAWVESSPCINQNCVETGFITRQGQWAACLPNNVLLIIHGAEDENVDAVAW